MNAQLADNTLYDRLADHWWDTDHSFYLLHTVLNPFRVQYLKQVLNKTDREPGHVLDLGCGGGLFSEELAKLGFTVTGVDPSIQSIEVARRHAQRQGLPIHYVVESGEQLPFADATFDWVVCCDVMEHVADVGKVVAEIARVLRPGGCFFWDTPNQTWYSKLVLIWLAQEWAVTACLPLKLHNWEQFITPAKLTEHLTRHSLQVRHTTGVSPVRPPGCVLLHLLTRFGRKVQYGRLAHLLQLRISTDQRILYAGWAIKQVSTRSGL